MESAISIDGGELWAAQNIRLQALKERNPSSPDNQPLGDQDLTKFMDPELYEATKTGDAEIFIDKLEAVFESNKLALSLIFDQVTPSGNSLLHVAASSGNEDVMKLILIHFPNLVTRKNASEDTPLHVAVQNKMLSATEMLIRLGTDWEIMYWKNKDSKSPLYLAAETGNLEILQLLLEASTGDEAYAAKIQGRSPVLAAVEVGKSDILEKILDRLPKLLHVHDEDGRTPLHCAASVGNVGAVKLLLSKCRYLALQTDKNGSYPIHIACEGGNVDTIRELMKMWPDLAEIKNKKDQNILHVAAEGGKIEVVECILNDCRWSNKLLNSKDVHGYTPLYSALRHGLLNIEVLWLLKLKATESGSLRLILEAIGQIAIPFIAPILRPFLQHLLTMEERSGESQLSSIENIKKEIEILLVAATLVASVTFTAGMTLPGGYNGSSDPHPGTPIMLHNGAFLVFVLFDWSATFCSTLSVVLLLQAHKSPTHAIGYSDIASRLLYWAVSLMAVAFLAALILAVRKIRWLVVVLAYFAAPYLLMLLVFLLQSLINWRMPSREMEK